MSVIAKKTVDNKINPIIISISNKTKTDNEVMKLLKVSELNHFIARTDKGELMLHIPFQGKSEDYRFKLDSVKVDDATNKELIKQFNGILYTL